MKGDNHEPELFRMQGGKCALCDETDYERLVADHDHKTGLVRGLLCRSCNIEEAYSTSARFREYRTNPPAGKRSWRYIDAQGFAVAPEPPWDPADSYDAIMAALK